MRSQIYEWDLFKGIPTTGGIAPAGVIKLGLQNGSVKNTTPTSNGTEPNNYTVGVTYQAQLRQGESPQNGATIVGNPNFTAVTVNTPFGGNPGDSGADYFSDFAPDTTPSGDGYAVGDRLVIVGNVAGVIDDDLTNILVTSIWDSGFGFVAGQVYNTVAVTGNGTGATFEIVNVNADGEVFGVSVNGGGQGYKIGDTLHIINPASPNTPVLLEVSYLSTNDVKGTTYVELGKPFSIFTDKGNTLPNNPSTKENQFIVVESFGCTPTAFFPGKDNGAVTAGPDKWTDANGEYRGQILKNSLFGPRAYMQFYINSTAYFKDSDGVVRNGIPGTFAPYPLSLQYDVCIERKQTPVYILPRQAWDLKITCFNQFSGTTFKNSSTLEDESFVASTRLNQVTCFFKYVLYDGIDMVIAMRLLEAGIRITPENVDEFKRNIFENNITLPNDEEE